MEWHKSASVFEAVVRSGSLSAAGRRLGLSPASVSRHISELEDTLDVRLLNRTSRRLSLTEAGSIYFDRIENILQQIADAQSAVNQLASVPRGTVRVHSRMLVGQQFVVPSLKRFSEQYPDLHVDLTMSNFEVDIVRQGVDIDIRIGKLRDTSLVARKLASSRRLLVAAPSYLEGRQPIADPHDLIHHSCLTYRLNLGTPVWRFRKDGPDSIEVPVTGFLTSDNGQAILTAALDGLGIAMMNDWTVQHMIDDGRLVRVLDGYSVAFSDFETGIYAVFQKSRHLPAKTRMLIDFLSQEFRRQLG
ncbi:MAG: LysR family transcriptional regulator [Jannaschia sp.]